LAPELAAGIARVKSAKMTGVRSGNWLSLRQAQALLSAPDVTMTRGLRDRACAKLCRAAGGELEQIQLLLGHASVQTTERYLGTRQDLVHAPNDAIKLRVAV
jgi:site-specific recombinase XerD